MSNIRSLRGDTANQREAKLRVAESRRCFHCGRKSAMSSRYELRDDLDIRRIGSARQCNYCGAIYGVRNGEVFREPPPNAR